MDIVEQYTTWLQENEKSRGTITVYLYALRKLIAWYEQREGVSFDVTRMTPLQLHDFYSYLKDREKIEHGTINKNMCGLKSFFRYAHDSGAISVNPAVTIKLKRVSKSEAATRWLTSDELAQFFHEIMENEREWIRVRDLAMCWVMAGAGLTVQEVSNLLISDICLEKKNETLKVQVKTEGKFRQVPLNTDVINALQAWLELHPSNSGYLFVSQSSPTIQVRSIFKVVAKYAGQAGLEDVSPQTLRHTFCKNLVDQGVPLQDVAALAGFDDLESMRRYTK